MGKDSISKLFIGHLPNDTEEEHFRNHLISGGITLRNQFNLTLKNNFALIDCGDQSTADLVIDKFNGTSYKGQNLSIEPAVSNFAGGANPRSEKVVITAAEVQDDGEIERGVSDSDIEMLMSSCSENVLSLEKQETGSFLVTVPDHEMAEKLIEKCNGQLVNGTRYKIELFSEQEGDTNDDQSLISSKGITKEREERASGLDNRISPLRILIPAELVGAIIGKSGSIIKSIAKETGARVVVCRSTGPRYCDVEKTVAITGKPDQCTAACKKILQILCQESPTGVEISLRLMALNSLIGRLIGKNGSCINKIMEDTKTKIRILNHQPITTPQLGSVNPHDFDRVIVVRGNVASMAQAENIISRKLRGAYESDLHQNSIKSFAPSKYRGYYPKTPTTTCGGDYFNHASYSPTYHQHHACGGASIPSLFPTCISPSPKY